MSDPEFADLWWLREERGAEIYAADGVDFPIVEFDGVRVIFEKRRSNEKTYRYTCVVADLPSGHFWAHLEPGGWFSSWSSDFNSRYSLDTNSRELAGQWLNGEVREAILACEPDFVEASSNVLVVQFSGHYTDPEDLGAILDCCDVIRASARAVKKEDREGILADLEHLAQPFHGRLEDDHPGGFPRLVFPEAILDIQTFQQVSSTGLPEVIEDEYRRESLTIFGAELEAPNLKIYPQSFWHFIPRLFGWQDFLTGDESFDKRFVVKCASEAYARRVLDERCRRHVQDLFDLPGKKLVLDVSGGVLQVINYHYLPVGYGDELRKFLASCMGILECLGVDPSAVSVVEITGSMEGLCRVCMSPLSSECAACAKCRTAHHRECWEYMGCCSTFGCGSTRTA